MRLLSIIFVAVLSFNASGQTCNSSMKPSAEPGQFVDLENGYVLDVVSMLKWNFCSLGQTYDQGVCTGTPNIYETFADALIVCGQLLPFGHCPDGSLQR